MGELVRALPLLVLAGLAGGTVPTPGASAPVGIPTLAGPPARAVADTTLPVRRGDVLVVENFSGKVDVRGSGTADRVELRARSGKGGDAGLERRGDRVVVVSRGRHAGERELDAVLLVPEWMEVRVQGRDLDVEIRDTGGPVDVRNVDGDIRLERTRGRVRASTVEGSVVAVGARGDLVLRSQGDDVRVEDAVTTSVDAESGDGDVRLVNVDAERVRAETLDGDVRLDVMIRPGGRYAVSVHDGDAEVRIPRNAGVRMRVATFDGEFVSDFPVVVERFESGRGFAFTLGDGGAEMDVRVFDGEIRIGERP